MERHAEDIKEDEGGLVEVDSLLTLEYYLLQKFSPSGVYIVPRYEDNVNLKEIVWDGIIFVKAGPYKDGKFWFSIYFTADYPKTVPRVQFHSLVFHPLINPQDGLLDLKVVMNTLKNTDSLVITIAGYIKKVFYCQDYWGITSSYNSKAGEVFMKSTEGFIKEARVSVEDAQKSLYKARDNNSLRFTKPIPEHSTILNKALEINKENV